MGDELIGYRVLVVNDKGRQVHYKEFARGDVDKAEKKAILHAGRAQKTYLGCDVLIEKMYRGSYGTGEKERGAEGR